MSREFRTSDGLTLRADEWGPTDGRLVLLVHGGGQTRRAWRATALTLADYGWRVVAPDLRGHGDSDWSVEGRYQLDAFADDLVAIADQLGAKPFVVGASLGGLAALVAEGGTKPESFASLTLVDITPRMEPLGLLRVVGFMAAYLDAGFESLEEAADAISRYSPTRPKSTKVSGLANYLRQGSDGRYRWHWDPNFIRNIIQTDGRTRAFADLEEMARRLTLPVQLIRGRMSDLVSEENARAFLDIVPHAQFVDISGAGHMVVGDRNDVFTDAVLAFLTTTIERKKIERGHL